MNSAIFRILLHTRDPGLNIAEMVLVTISSMQTLKPQVNRTNTLTPLKILNYNNMQLRWLQYLERLNAGAWGDHIAVQGLADMLRLHVDISIISTINPDMDLIKTSHHTSIGVVHLGLIGQFHYQALESRHPGSSSSDNLDQDQESIEDEEALKHQAQLRGLPYDSCLLREDTVDVTPDRTVLVAPEANQHPYRSAL